MLGSADSGACGRKPPATLALASSRLLHAFGALRKTPMARCNAQPW